MKEYNQLALSKSLDTLVKCRSAKDAREKSDGLVKAIEMSGAKIDGCSVAIIDFDNKKYTAIIANVDGSELLLKATLLGKKVTYFVPSVVWAIGNNGGDEFVLMPVVSSRKLNKEELDFCKMQDMRVSSLVVQ